MGQEQLLLLVPGTIIVAGATLAGLDAFSRSSRRSAINRMTQEAIQIATDVQEYAQRPDILRPKNTTGDNDLVVDFGELSNYETDGGQWDGDHVDVYATYSLNGHNSLPGAYNSHACPDNNPINTVEAYSEKYDVSVCVSITGTSADDIDVGVAQ